MSEEFSVVVGSVTVGNTLFPLLKAFPRPARINKEARLELSFALNILNRYNAVMDDETLSDLLTRYKR